MAVWPLFVHGSEKRGIGRDYHVVVDSGDGLLDLERRQWWRREKRVERSDFEFFRERESEKGGGERLEKTKVVGHCCHCGRRH